MSYPVAVHVLSEVEKETVTSLADAVTSAQQKFETFNNSLLLRIQRDNDILKHTHSHHQELRYIGGFKSAVVEQRLR
jgi:hypothetical protein